MAYKLLSIVLPVYNQADHIAAVVAKYIDALATFPIAYELILVVNGCKDDSHGVCLRLAQQDIRIRVVYSIPGGWGLAVRLGLSEARGDLLCYTNSARTSAATLRHVLDTAVLCPGHITKSVRIKRHVMMRSIGSFLYNIECRMIFGNRIKDVNGTPKCFPRAFNKLLCLRERGDLIDAEFMAICERESYPLCNINVSFSQRQGGDSTTTLRSARKMIFGIWGLWNRLRDDDKSKKHVC